MPLPPAGDQRQLLISELATTHGQRVHRYLMAKLRNAVADVPDLFQEIFLRVLRVERPEMIRNPEAYLLTIARHVLYQHRIRRSGEPDAVDVMEVLAEIEDTHSPAAEDQIDAQQRVAHLEKELSRLPPKAYATLILHRVKGQTLEQIAGQLGVSRSMVKKYLATALAHCEQLSEGE